MRRREFLEGAGVLLAGAASKNLFAAKDDRSGAVISVDLGKMTGALPHYWSKVAGSDRVAVGLRAQWQEDLIRVHQDIGLRSVRSHGLFNEEMGIASDGLGRLNFIYLDQVYDFMLDHEVKPFVELSFMPIALASSSNSIFFYQGNTSPPRNWQDWHDLVKAFTEHCVSRYGLAEVRQWKFEVWNEPNLDFWCGTQEEYFELYRQSVMALKSVDKELCVGGPATAQLDWIPDFIRYCSSRDLPVDFISSHTYPDDPQKKLFGRDNMYPPEQVMPRGLEQVKHQIESSAMPRLPLWITEWSSSNPAFIFEMVQKCAGLAEAISYWTFSNVFEELGIPADIFNRSYGMVGQRGIATPALHAFTFLNKIGQERLGSSDGPVLATRRADGSLAVLVWNLIPAKARPSILGNSDEAAGPDLSLTLALSGLAERNRVRISRIGGDVGTAIKEWKALGSPKYPSSNQVAKLREAAELPPPEIRSLSRESPQNLQIQLPPNGVALLEFDK